MTDNCNKDELVNCIIDNPTNMRREVIINSHVVASMCGLMLYRRSLNRVSMPFYFNVNPDFNPGTMPYYLTKLVLQ